MPSSLEQKLKKVRLLFFDVDGTLTDGSLLFDADGRELKAFFARDGSRMTLARKAGLKIFFITSRVTPAIRARAKERKIEGIIGKEDLPDKSLLPLLLKLGLSPEESLYLGDDLNDIPFLRQAGVKAAVADAAAEVQALADIVTALPGGRGAAAEIIERVLRAQGLWDKLIASL